MARYRAAKQSRADAHRPGHGRPSLVSLRLGERCSDLLCSDKACTAGEVVYNQALDRQSMSWVVAGEFHLYLWKEAGVAVLGRKMVPGNVLGLPGICGFSAAETIQCKRRGTMRCLSQAALERLRAE